MFLQLPVLRLAVHLIITSTATPLTFSMAHGRLHRPVIIYLWLLTSKSEERITRFHCCNTQQWLILCNICWVPLSAKFVGLRFLSPHRSLLRFLRFLRVLLFSRSGFIVLASGHIDLVWRQIVGCNRYRCPHALMPWAHNQVACSRRQALPYRSYLKSCCKCAYVHTFAVMSVELEHRKHGLCAARVHIAYTSPGV